MKLGIIGLPGSGRSTIFEALTHSSADASHKNETKIGMVRVPDERVDVLSAMHKPRKTIYAQIEYFLPRSVGHAKDNKQDQSFWAKVRESDALIHVVRNFLGTGHTEVTPGSDVIALNQELILADLVVTEKRLERLKHENRRGKKYNPDEFSLLKECLENLENEIPLRDVPELAFAQLLRGYAFLSAKPVLVLFNNEDDDEKPPGTPAADIFGEHMVIRGKLEQELAQMTDAEAAEFLAEFSITASAMDRVLRRSYDLLGLISFFTVGEDEVRAWTIRKDTDAVDAADVIHSDIKKGFIRAEVVAYADLMDAGSHAEARKRGTVRLEGKIYQVQNGDIINFRFNV
ncbi:MAG: redox-regulated ATPase YchF [Deltaproteobacteria bacterium]|nr:redox-regulated ATPase YchF [Deltaproteobacteria bacterium]MBW2676659.1 redox-regulated ATPase YchF [Deltaproteobacteria bacterium]